MDRQPQAALAERCLYYMSMMREIEDRIERKLAHGIEVYEK